MVVANSVTVDARVLKTADAAVRYDLDVVVIGHSPTGAREDGRHPLGFRLIRLPGVRRVTGWTRAEQWAGRRWRWGAANVAVLASIDERHHVQERLSRGALGQRAARLVRAKLAGGRRRAWRTEFPLISDLQPEVSRELAALRPSIVHAHDFTGLALAAPAVRERRAAGHTTSLIYDAHEYVRGLTTYSAHRHGAAVRLENEYLGCADKIVTVSAPLAERLASDHNLLEKPAVIMNVPWRYGGHSGPSIRRALRLGWDAPLLVYAGNAKPIRGLTDVVDAVAGLPDVHAAFVSAPTRHLEELLLLAAERDCRDRVHALPYVPSAEVASFLRDATVGLNPLRRYGNADVALPNKIFDYLHANLPMVVSDAPAIAGLVRELGVGEVYEAGDVGALRRAVQRVLEGPDRYRLKRSHRTEVLDEYAWERQAERLMDTYRELLELPVAGSPMTP